MRMITLYVPEGYLDCLNNLVKQGVYPNRAEAIRMAIHDLIIAEEKVKTSHAVFDETFSKGQKGFGGGEP